MAEKMKLIRVTRKTDGAETVINKFNSNLHDMLVELSLLTFVGNPDSTTKYAKMDYKEADKTYDALKKMQKQLGEVNSYLAKAIQAVGSVN